MADKLTYTHPLFMNPGDTPGTMLILVKLTGSDNYGMWSRSMHIALMAKRKLGLVTGTLLVDLLSGIVYASDSHAVLKDLQERFDKVNRMRIFQIHRQIATLSQGINLVSVYFSKLKELWADYDAVVPPPGCDCAKSKDYIEHVYQQRLL
ncbi:uncharacterized protein LOC142169704 [Nicotiana tabacum]|uniref:Uncharacterized protein LOC142169704 n=1 Tax=Nicotiana tabacum TaxID=4097 RepID=A0AC58SRV4_TOBAC